MKILMVAAENGAFPGGKVGGIGDVIRDIPLALAAQGQEVDIVVPGYGVFATLPNATWTCRLQVLFWGKSQQVDVYQLTQANDQLNIRQWVVEHPLFAACGLGKIYCNDPDNQPFATDASKFALFSAAVANAVINNVFGNIDILHLHDWHTAMIAVLRAFDPQYRQLKSIHTVYTIHNLALQGIRPFADDESSLNSWFTALKYHQQTIMDPTFTQCVNPMRAAINLVDKIHAVSPNYAGEILLPSDSEHGYFGGEGLERDLCKANEEHRLHGILNGCDYHYDRAPAPSLQQLFALFEQVLLSWVGDNPLVASAHLIAITRLSQWLALPHDDEQLLITAIGRITPQKYHLLQQPLPGGGSALEQLLEILGDRGLLVLLGSGDVKLEAFFTNVAAKSTNFLFLKGYSDVLPQYLYDSGDLFLMPSSFEPCGISQMLAMRSGQPCLVHEVGGLSDTVGHRVNGFTFDGNTPVQQAMNMVACFKSALQLKSDDPSLWHNIADNAARSRFLWRDAAQAYLKYLYPTGLDICDNA